MHRLARPLLAAVAALAAAVPAVAPLPAAAVPTQAAVTARTVVGGLAAPAAFAVAPDGSVYFAELTTGVVKRWRAGATTTVLAVPGQRQALGMTLSPRFSSDRLIYLYGARTVAGRLRLQLTRFTAAGTGFTVLRDVGPRPAEHSGGPVRFGPDGNLYLSVGDEDRAANAQDMSSPAGKILRMTPGGGAVGGTRVFARGLRNAFGLAFDPRSGRMWSTDNGPDCNDEVNLIRRGANYGWGPSATCTTPPTVASTNADGPSPVLPKVFFGRTVAPTGVAFCVGCGLGSATEGSLLYGTFVTSQIRRAALNGTRTAVARDALLYDSPAPVLAVVRAPDGSVWFSDTGRIAKLVAG